MAQNFVYREKQITMKKTYLSALVIASALFFSCGTSGTTDQDKDSVNSGDTTSSTMMSPDTTTKMASSTDTVSKMDKDFMMAAGAGGNTEVLASQLAVERSSNDRVKSFANMMISDHTKAGGELKTLASQKNVMLPDSVMTDQHKALDDLRKESSKNFDKAYMKMMNKDHKETIDKFQMASEKCENGDVRAFASKTLPTLKMHKDSVDAVQKSL